MMVLATINLLFARNQGVENVLVFSFGLQGALFALVVIFAIKLDYALAGGVAADLWLAGWFCELGVVRRCHGNSSVVLLNIVLF